MNATRDNTAICVPNWLGDSIMSMPAVQAFAKLNPGARLILVAKPRISDLWRMHAAGGEIVELRPGLAGVLRAARQLRRANCARAFVLPLSVRSALVPFLAGIKPRTGMRGHRGYPLLTDIVAETGLDAKHQCFEYMRVMGAPESAFEAPRLSPPPQAMAAVRARLSGDDRPAVVLVPGAARGPSKQWPADYYARLGRLLTAEGGCRLVVAGSASEKTLCAQVASAAGRPEADWSGASLAECAALFSIAAAVVANDSGGMHLACALGAPTVAIYGLTSPEKTGPLGGGAVILRQPGAAGARAISRHSEEAQAALRSVSPEQAFDVVRKTVLRHNGAP